MLEDTWRISRTLHVLLAIHLRHCDWWTAAFGRGKYEAIGVQPRAEASCANAAAIRSRSRVWR